MDLNKLMLFYHSCPSFVSVTYTNDGAIEMAPRGALREGYPFLATGAEHLPDPQVLAAGTSIVLNTGDGFNQGYEAGKSGTQIIKWMPSSRASQTSVGFRYRSHEVLLTGPCTAREMLETFARNVAAQCGRNNLLQDFLTGSDYYLHEVDRKIAQWSYDADTSDDEHEMVAAAAAVTGPDPGIKYGSRRAPPWRPPHWRRITEEEFAPFLNYDPRTPGSVPVLEFTPDPVKNMSTNKLLVAADDICHTCALVGFEPITNAAAPSGGPVHHYKAIWSKPFC